MAFQTLVRYYVNKGTGGLTLIGPNGEVDKSNYRVDTGATFYYEAADVTVVSQEWQNDVDFYMDAEVTMPTPVNASAYAYEHGTKAIWPVQHSIESLGGSRFQAEVAKLFNNQDYNSALKTCKRKTL